MHFDTNFIKIGQTLSELRTFKDIKIAEIG